MPLKKSVKAKPKSKPKSKLCFGCDRRKAKYADGLCEPCHRIALEAAPPVEAAPPPESVPDLIIPEEEVSFGQALRWLRHQRRRTTHQLANALDVTAVFLNDVEHDRKDMTPEQTVKAAQVLGTPLLGLLLRRGKFAPMSETLSTWLKHDPAFAEFLKKAKKYDEPRTGGVLRGPCMCGCPCCGGLY